MTIVSVGAGSYGPDGQHVVITYGPGNHPPEVIANDIRAVQQRDSLASVLTLWVWNQAG